MSLRSKLFLAIGAVIVVMALIMALLVGFFVEKDVFKATQKMRQLIRREQVELESSETTLLARQLEEVKGNIDALLFLISDSEELKKGLSLEDPEKGWEAASQVIAFDPDIGVLQLNDPKLGEACVILANGRSLYPSSIVSESEGIKWILARDQDGEEKGLFVAIPIPQAPGYFALMSFEDLQSASIDALQKGALKQGVDEVTAALVKVYGELKDLDPRKLFERSVKKIPISPSKESLTLPEAQERWALEMRMIELLAPLVAEGLSLYPGKNNVIPSGIAYAALENSGFVILSSDVFRSSPIFDDASYFNTHQPDPKASPIARGSTLMHDSLSGQLFLGNTLKLNGSFISLGSSIENLAKGLALAANRTVIIETNGKMGIGFTRKGEALASNQLRSFHTTLGRFKEDKGMIPFMGAEYFFFKIPIDPIWQIDVYVLTPQEREMALVRALLQVYQKIKQKIFLQILIVSFLMLIFALCILGWITRGITRPISFLAKAMGDVGAGKLESAVVPEVGSRHDEVAVLTRAFAEMIEQLKEREMMRGVLNKVVSKEVADAILKSDLHLGGEDRVCTMLFSDIRGFTELSENLQPQEVIQLLNSCMTKMSRVIEGEGGVIDKYVGDEIMALYGAPITHPDHAIRALSSAKLMIETLKKWNEERIREGMAPIEMGIGIHTGLVVAGNMGAESRLNYTVLGANVNLAARLCQVAKPMQIIISESTLEQELVKDSFVVEPLPSISLKGFSEPVKIYQIVGFKWG